ncbi:hypothetical protein [Paracoccus actinidiae]|jgi:hypothetical protein|nr:hypothetical protein [Paracoccus sp. M09]
MGKHPKSDDPTDKDLREDPGIGGSKGAGRDDPEIGATIPLKATC